MDVVFTNSLEDWVSILGRVIPKTQNLKSIGKEAFGYTFDNGHSR